MPLDDQELNAELDRIDPRPSPEEIVKRRQDLSDAIPVIELDDGDQLVYKEGTFIRVSDKMPLSKVGLATARKLIDVIQSETIPDEVQREAIRLMKNSRLKNKKS